MEPTMSNTAQEGATRPDGTIVPRTAEWSQAGRDGFTVIWDAATAPLTHVWDVNAREWCETAPESSHLLGHGCHGCGHRFFTIESAANHHAETGHNVTPINPQRVATLTPNIFETRPA
jgi:hypothetical protein